MKHPKLQNILLILLTITLTTTYITYAENQPPQPSFISPKNTPYLKSNTVTITEKTITIEAIDLTGENDIVSATFEFQQEEYHWIYLGFDDNPQSPSIQFQGNKTTNAIGGTAWTANWDLGIFGEGYYLLRVVFEDSVGQTGSNTIQVYYDPNSPQTAFNYNLEPVKICGNHSLKITNSGNNILVLNVSQLSLTYPTIIQTGLGDADQNNIGLSNNTTNNYGGPTAAANALWRLIDTSASPTELTQELANKCTTDPINGTSSHDLTTGLLNYLYSTGVSQEYSLSSFETIVNSDGTLINKPKWTRYWDALKKESSIIVLLTNPGPDGVPATIDDQTQYYTGQGGNLDTLTISLIDPDGAVSIHGLVKPTPNVNGFESVWLDVNMDDEISSDEVWYLLSLWSIEPTEKTWSLIDQDITPIDGLSIYWDTTTVQDGYYYLKTTVTDIRSVEASAYGTFYVNNHLPTAAQLTSPTIADTGQTKVVLHWTLCGDKDFNTYEIYVNGTKTETITDQSTTTILVSELSPDTRYKITLRTNDYANSYDESTVYIETKPVESGQDDIDTEAPDVNILTDVPSIINVNTVDIEWIVDEPVKTTTYTLDQSSPITVTMTSIRLSDLEEGTHTVKILVEDYSEYTGEDQITFTVDTVSPTIGTPSWSVVATEDRYLINIGVTVEDATSDVTSVECITTELTSTTNRVMMKSGSTYTCSFITQAVNLPITFSIKAVDSAGNTVLDNNDQQSYTIEYEEIESEPSPINTIVVAGLAVVSIIVLILIVNIVRRTRV